MKNLNRFDQADKKFNILNQKIDLKFNSLSEKIKSMSGRIEKTRQKGKFRGCERNYEQS